MKHIIKQEQPELFSKWKAKSNDDWQPTYEILSGDIKKAVKDTLMTEQGYLCCYCEQRLDDKSHIEHFRPQSDPTVDPLDFTNMLCSCQNQLQKGEPRHCGNLKGGWFDEILLVSPFDPSCATKFRYIADGSISPYDLKDNAAKETIDKLGLNIPKLIAMRNSAIEPFLEDTLNPDELQEFVDGYLTQDELGMFSEFWTTIRYVFGADTE